MAVSQLGYIGVDTRDLAAWLDVGRNVIGLEPLDDAGPAGERYFRMDDDRPHRLIVQPSDVDDLAYAGWQVETPDDFDRIVATLAARGIATEDMADDVRKARQVERLVAFRDPAGYANELYLPGARPTGHFASALPIAGFVTGEFGLGHIVRHCADKPALVGFYTDVLGFRISDNIVWADADATFMRCNARHHSLALINESIGHRDGQTNHVMFDLQSLDDVGRAYDEVLRRGYPIIMTLGRHSNDLNTSFYFVGPSGFGIEIGTGAILVRDEAAWEVKTFGSTRLWGHLLPHERAGEAA